MTRTRNIPQASTRAFTLVELLMSVLILGILAGLLIVGVRASRRFVSSVSDRGGVETIKTAVSKFIADYHFPPPLVRDQAGGAGGGGSGGASKASVEAISLGNGGPIRARFAVYNFNTIDAPAAMLDFLKGKTPAPGSNSTNVLEDFRYSERSLAFYLMGACNVAIESGKPDLPIDGVPGAGFFPPNQDGSFSVPARIYAMAGTTPTLSPKQATRRTGRKSEALIDPNGRGLVMKYLSAAESPTNEDESSVDNAGARFVTVVDSHGVPIRYYRWLNLEKSDLPANAPANQFFRLPPLVGIDPTAPAWSAVQGLVDALPDERKITSNAELRSATYAIVAAGPDGLFGDEPWSVISQKLNLPSTVDDYVRFNAMKDNIVEVGQ